jgi:N6-L-threonylcarbamoyladenine synthase
MLTLAIESSCDETSIAILQDFNQEKSQENFYQNINSIKTLINLVSSQINVHKEFGGVVPELGAREHARNINQLFLLAIKKVSQKLSITELEVHQKISKIVVTSTPGLSSALKVGVEFAKSLQFFLDKELGVKTDLKLANHLKGHILSCFYKNLEEGQNLDLKNEFANKNTKIFPHLHLLVSGGNTQLLLLKNQKEFEIIGKTLDDAAGETLDKAGRMMGLPYPAGIWIAKIADLNHTNYFNLPIGMAKKPGLDFSYSGLKTAIRYFVQKQNFENWKFEKKLTEDFINKIILEKKELEKTLNQGKNLDKSNILTRFKKEDLELVKFIYQLCCSTQSVVISQLIQKFKKGIKEYNPASIGISGGVSANLLLRQEVKKIFDNSKIFIPHQTLTGDNAVMIGLSEML